MINGFKSHESAEIVEISKQLVRKWKKQVIDSTSDSTSDVKETAPKKIVEKGPLQVYFYRPNVKKSSKCYHCIDGC